MISFELVCIKNHAVLVLIVLGSCVLVDNILSMIGLLIMVQCQVIGYGTMPGYWLWCSAGLCAGLCVGLCSRSSAVFASEFGSVCIEVPTQWMMIFGIGSASRISTL
jgi:hypothetical protein